MISDAKHGVHHSLEVGLSGRNNGEDVVVQHNNVEMTEQFVIYTQDARV